MSEKCGKISVKASQGHLRIDEFSRLALKEIRHCMAEKLFRGSIKTLREVQWQLLL